MDRITRALRLLEEIEAMHGLEAGFIDPSDYDRFSCDDLLRVADGEASLDGIVWGTAGARNEQRQLEEWNRRASQQEG